MWVFPVLWKKAQGGVVIYLRHLACWETLGWELRARARHVTQTDGDFLKFSRCFGGLKSWNLHIFWVLKMLLTILVSETMAFFWVFFSLFHTLKSDPSTFFLTKKKTIQKASTLTRDFFTTTTRLSLWSPQDPTAGRMSASGWKLNDSSNFHHDLLILYISKKSWQFFVTFFLGWLSDPFQG